jgi:hypothetical protein
MENDRVECNKRIRLMASALPAPNRATMVAEIIRMKAMKSGNYKSETANLDISFKNTFSNGVTNFIRSIHCHMYENNFSYTVNMRHNANFHRGGLASWDEVAASIVEALEGEVCMDCWGLGGDDHACKVQMQAVFLNLAPEECSICQEKCTGVTRLGCGHAFHRVCISKSIARVCPNCRTRVSIQQALETGMRSDVEESEDESVSE